MPSPPRIRGLAFVPGSPAHPVGSWEALDRFSGDKRFAWLDVEGEPDADMETLLGDKLGWHPVVFQGMRRPAARLRFTPFEDYSHLTVRAAAAGNGERERRAAETDIVLGASYLITFHRAPVPWMDKVFEETGAMKSPPRSPDLVLSRILAGAVEASAPAVDRMDDVLTELEEEALYHPGSDLLERIVHVRDSLYMLHLSLAPQLQVLNDLTSGACRFVTPFARPFLKSAENRLRGLLDDVAIYKEVAQNSLELHRSAMTQKTNEVIRVLTVVSAPLLVLSFLSGLYGMNVGLPFEGHPLAFAGILGVSLGVFLLMMWWFRRRGWI